MQAPNPRARLKAKFFGKGWSCQHIGLVAAFDGQAYSSWCHWLLSVNKSQLHFINNTSYSGIPDCYNFANSTKWAPFNVGASANPQSAEDFYGNYYAWGETEQRDSYAAESYKYADNQESIGITRTYRGDADVPINMGHLRYKVWCRKSQMGKGWRMPLLQELFGFTGDNEILDVIQGRKTTTNTSFKTKDVSEYNGVAVNGRTFWRNGKTLFLPFAGRYYYTASAPATQVSLLGRAGCYLWLLHNNIQARRSLQAVCQN